MTVAVSDSMPYRPDTEGMALNDCATEPDMAPAPELVYSPVSAPEAMTIRDPGSEDVHMESPHNREDLAPAGEGQMVEGLKPEIDLNGLVVASASG